MSETTSEPQPALVLIVDDDTTTRALLRRLLQTDGYRTAEAQDGIQALNLCQRLCPSLILLDAVMPKMDGFEACARLQKLPGADRRPVLMVTNLDTPEAINQAFAAGASDYITKPIQWPVLRQRVRWLVRAGQAEEVIPKIYAELVQLNAALRQERETRQQAEAWQNALAIGLRALVATTGELLACPERDTLLRRAVELAREKLELERCAIFVECGDYLCGTYGTDRYGRTTDERAQRFPPDADWIKRFGLLNPKGPYWLLADEPHIEWNGTSAIPFGRGWIAVTPIQSANRTPGFFINDAAISHAPVNPEKQEVVVAYCSLLGSIFEHQQAVDAKVG
jgi:CheY-like chemotaxis protein